MPYSGNVVFHSQSADWGKIVRHSMSLAPGAHLGPYEILAPIGAGGMGEVFRRFTDWKNRTVFAPW